MLIDDVIAGGVPGYGASIDTVIPALRAAQKFVLAPDSAAVADALACDYTGLVKAFEFCRLPYGSTWIEVAHQDRPNFRDGVVFAPSFQVRPHRIGYLLTAMRDDLSAWKAHLFWSTQKGCSCAAIAMQFDMTRPILPRETLPTPEESAAYKTKRKQRGIVTADVASHPGWDSAGASVQLAMLQHTQPAQPDYPLPMPAIEDQLALMSDPELFNKFCAGVVELAAADWAGEAAYLLAIIGLLNARNAVETGAVDYARLNRARVKSGKLPLFEHRVLKIAHRHHQRVYGESGARGDYSPMRGHFVRGHFKTRRTGIFFWHPHARGDFGKGRIDKDYELT